MQREIQNIFEEKQAIVTICHLSMMPWPAFDDVFSLEFERLQAH